MLSLVRSFLEGDRAVDLARIDDAVFTRALDLGLGPILARISDKSSGPRRDEVLGADLAARVLSGAWIDCIEQVLARCATFGCRPLLLKGGAVALTEYPEPHLRTMGDIDLVVPAAQVALLEGALREMGFSQPYEGNRYDGHHHSRPFFHSAHGVWIEVHSRLFPPTSPAGREPRLAFEAVGNCLTPAAVGGEPVAVMTRELQLVYTSARWAEMINPDRGIFPIVDAGLVVRNSPALDWTAVLSLAGADWTASALHTLLTFLAGYELAAIPAPILDELARRDRYSNRVTRRALHALTLRVVFGQQPLSRRVLRTVWGTLATDMNPLLKVPAAVVNVLLRPAAERPLRLRRGA